MQVRRQTKFIEIPANSNGVVDNEINLDTDFSKAVGITIYNKGNHTNYQVGIKRKRGAVLEDFSPFEHYSKTEMDRFAPTDIDINNDALLIRTNIDVAANNAIQFVIVFTLEK